MSIPMSALGTSNLRTRNERHVGMASRGRIYETCETFVSPSFKNFENLKRDSAYTTSKTLRCLATSGK